MLTQPPLQLQTQRLEILLPRVHTLYLPQVDGVTASLMQATLQAVSLDDIEIVYLQDGDKRVIYGTTVRVRALNLGRFEVEVVP